METLQGFHINDLGSVAIAKSWRSGYGRHLPRSKNCWRADFELFVRAYFRRGRGAAITATKGSSCRCAQGSQCR